MSVNIEVGKYYRTRDGLKVGPMRMWDESGGIDHPWEQLGGSDIYKKGGDIWRDDGTSHYLDEKGWIISEWMDDDAELNATCGGPVKQGTLKELDAKPGDVVSYWGVDEYKVGDDQNLISVNTGQDFGKYKYWDTCSTFSIVSRASGTPKTWGEMSDDEKCVLLLAAHEGKVIENNAIPGRWVAALPVWENNVAYRVKPELKKETVTLWYVNNTKVGPRYYDEATHKITFTTTDGKPDLDSIKMEEV